MSPPAILFLSAFGVGVGFLVWRLATMKTDPPGYARLVTLSEPDAARRAKSLLEDAGVPVLLDEHVGRSVRTGTHFGPTHILVPSDRVQEAARVLQEFDPDADDLT